MGEQLRIEVLDSLKPKTDGELLERIDLLETLVSDIAANLSADDGNVVREELIVECARASRELEDLVAVAIERGVYESYESEMQIDDTRILMEVA